MKSTKNLALYIAFIIALGACKSIKPNHIALESKIDSSKAIINFQTKKIYRFNNGTVTFSNQFAAARLNTVTQQNDSTFTLAIEPENTPINPSPWYAFKLWTTETKKLTLILDYKGTTHRYDPKTQSSAIHSWKEIKDVKVSDSKKQAEFKVQASPDTMLITGQELISSADANKWMDSLVQFNNLEKQTIGYSVLGKPIVALNTKGSSGKKIVVVLSRQHPPEVTGYMAMQEFVKTIVANTTLAQNFKKQYELIIIPMINPDGVDEGNWRHSVAGVDLNRDWELFLQPETKSIETYLLKKIANKNAKIYFGIDFHSTYNDVFYTNEDQPLKQTNWPDFTKQWLAALKQAIPNFNPNIKPSPNGGNVSKSWMGRVLNAEALTYEVGDNTSRVDLKLKGRVAAEKMMELLLIQIK